MSTGSEIFKNIVNNKISNFIDTYGEYADSIFKNDNNKLIHPGEYGKYREESVKNILKCFIDENKTITDGFVINYKNEHSSQLDLIVLDKNYIGLSNDNLAKFYPVEFVLSFGEVKSNLSYSQFKQALQKMSENKKIFEGRKISKISGKDCVKESYYPITFLICRKLNFSLDENDLNEKFKNDIYKDIPREYWHNAILSLEDGLFEYKLETNELIKRVPNSLFKPDKICACIYPYYILPNKEKVEYDIQIMEASRNERFKHILYFFSMLSEIDRMYSFGFNINRYLDLEPDVIDNSLDLPY